VTAAFFNRRRRGRVLGHIKLDEEHAVEVVGLAPPILYFVFIWWKGSLTIFDSIVLTGFYVAYLYILNKIPPRSEESIEDMERIPRTILSLPPRSETGQSPDCLLPAGSSLPLTPSWKACWLWPCRWVFPNSYFSNGWRPSCRNFRRR